MNRQTWVIFFLLLFSSTGCSAAPATSTATPAMMRSFHLATWDGTLEVKPAGSVGFAPAQKDQALRQGDSLRTQGAKAFGEVRGDDGTFFVIGPNAQATLTLLGGSSQAPENRISLEKGGVLVVAERSLGTGFFEVATSSGSGMIRGSAMVVEMTINASTTVTCTQGSATATAAGGAPQNLSLGQSTSLAVGNNATAAAFEQNLAQKDPLLWQVLSDRYYHYGVEISPTPIPTSPFSMPSPTASSTPKPSPTITPFIIGPTATRRFDPNTPTPRPTGNYPPGFSGLTNEEKLNESSHNYGVFCQAWGKCVCDSANAVPMVGMTITFNKDKVEMRSGRDVLEYPKISPNLYRVSSNNRTADITFTNEGWEFYVTNSGAACSLQTYTRLGGTLIPPSNP